MLATGFEHALAEEKAALVAERAREEIMCRKGIFARAKQLPDAVGEYLIDSCGRAA